MFPTSNMKSLYSVNTQKSSAFCTFAEYRHIQQKSPPPFGEGVERRIKISGFKCPFCGQIMSLNSTTESVYRISTNGVVDFIRNPNVPYAELLILSCPNDDCKKEAVFVGGKNGFMENRFYKVHPRAIYNHYPDYVPLAVRLDYEEAKTIQSDSPKAAATLARRCMQGMIRDFWGIKKGRLIDEIKELREKVPAAQWKAIDAVRNIGNIGAHMEKDVNQIIDVEPEEAEALLSLIELLIEKWYINRHDEEEIFKKITESGQRKKLKAKHQA